jgi:hypothetical protein
MNNEKLKATFTDDVLERLFPPEKTRDFFEALFGDDSEGAFDITLRYGGLDEQASLLRFYLDLHERPGCCLVCSLTHGLPEVFSRHPVINVKGLVNEIEQHLDGAVKCVQWKLDSTSQEKKSLHSVPLTIFLEAA